jgi:hypothetical protein
MELDDAIEESLGHRCSTIWVAEYNEVHELREPVHHH